MASTNTDPSVDAIEYNNEWTDERTGQHQQNASRLSGGHTNTSASIVSTSTTNTSPSAGAIRQNNGLTGQHQHQRVERPTGQLQHTHQRLEQRARQHQRQYNANECKQHDNTRITADTVEYTNEQTGQHQHERRRVSTRHTNTSPSTMPVSTTNPLTPVLAPMPPARTPNEANCAGQH